MCRIPAGKEPGPGRLLKESLEIQRFRGTRAAQGSLKAATDPPERAAGTDRTRARRIGTEAKGFVLLPVPRAPVRAASVGEGWERLLRAGSIGPLIGHTLRRLGRVRRTLVTPVPGLVGEAGGVAGRIGEHETETCGMPL